MTAEPSAGNQDFNVVAATCGDHPAILQFLADNFQHPSANEFQTQLDEPAYEPNDRLLVKRRRQIVGHVRLVAREIMFGDRWLPALAIADLAVLPEYEPHGARQVLIDAVGGRMCDEGMAFGLLCTTTPESYRPLGWLELPCPYFSQSPVRDVLAFLKDVPTFADCSAADPPLHIRFWRHMELNALRCLYEENIPGRYGAARRSEAYWHWLVSRRAYDRIYVALEGSPKPELHADAGNVVGYAVTTADRIHEMMTSADRPDAALRLLQRACGDAIEQDHLELRVDAPPNHPIHSVMRMACESLPAPRRDEQVWMAKWATAQAPLKWLRDALCRRAKDAGLEMPVELGLLLDGEKYSLEVTGRTARLHEGHVGRSYLIGSREDFHKLLFGATDVSKAVESGRLEASTRVAADLARVLFPRLPLWFSHWDDLPA